MYRAQILLEEWQHEALRTRAERDGVSISETVRAIVTAHLRRSRRPAAGLDDIEGIGEDARVSGRDHDRVLYGRARGR